jgi:hypothetical protein
MTDTTRTSLTNTNTTAENTPIVDPTQGQQINHQTFQNMLTVLSAMVSHTHNYTDTWTDNCNCNCTCACSRGQI